MRQPITVLVLLFAACHSSGRPGTFPLLAGLRGASFPLRVESREAQRYFDQGLTLYWGFDHEEAKKCFARAAELAPESPLPYWGLAHAASPHINNPTVDEESNRAALEALAAARARLAGAAPLERLLVEAQATRFALPMPADRKPLDQAYAAAMEAVWKQYPDQAEVGTLYAESRMNLRPWDLWTPAGEARPETSEILDVLTRVLALDPVHPGANHLAIHAWEMSPTPEKALSSADRLRELVPLAAHLVHMPGHIDLRLGRYDDAVRANQRAIEAARARVGRSGAGGFYALYRAHNYHFLVFSALFEGRSELALENARELLRELPAEAVAAYPEFIEGFVATPLHVLVRFGRWEEILAEPAPAAGLPGTRAFWHYARALALSALGRLDAAEAERTAFEAAHDAVPENYSIGNNSTRTVLDIGRAMLAGELAYRRGRHAQAFEHLRMAVARDEALRYDEPWGWFQPASHALGALLLEQGQLAEAERVYRRDLELHPENGWALHGLEECLRRSERTREADEVRARFQRSWKRADVKIQASCFCRTQVDGTD